MKIGYQILIIIFIAGCTAQPVSTNVTSTPSGSEVYFGKSPKSLKRLKINYKDDLLTPGFVSISKPRADTGGHCFRVHLQGYAYPPVKCFDNPVSGRTVHFELQEINEKQIDYGAYPDNYEEITKAYFEKFLLDPESARYRFISKPSRDSGFACVFITRQTLGRYNESFGAQQGCYKVLFFVNARNTFGGYTGEQVGYIIIRNGNAIGGTDLK